MNKILVPTDFSSASENAFELACQISAVGNQEIELLHIKGGGTEKLLKEKNKPFDQLEEYLDELCKSAMDEHAVTANYRIEGGRILTGVPAAASEPEIELVVMETYGPRGISKSIHKNIEKAEEFYTQEGISNKRVREEMTAFSVGFANQTIRYAEKTGAKMIAVMAKDSGNLSFISSVDRENLINNDNGISILVVSE